MSMLINPYRFGVPAAPDFIALPLTYDEADYHGALTWTRNGGPLPTPQGGVFDGYEARIKASSGLPSWITGASDPVAIQMSITPFRAPQDGVNHMYVGGIGTNDAKNRPKLGFRAVQDAYITDVATIQGMATVSPTAFGVFQICRQGWRFERNYPELSVGGFQARPQAVCFEDADTLLITAHYEDSVSRCHRVRLSDGEVLGWFDFNQATLGSTHINACAKAADGSYWFTGNDKLFKVDLAASFAANAASLLVTYNIAAAGGDMLAITTISGTEYVIVGQYLTTGTPYMVVFPMSLVSDGGTFDIANRTNRYVVNHRIQGIRYHGGKLYMSMNRTTAQGSGSYGYIHRYTLDLGAADGSSLVTPEAQWAAPSPYPEDIDFHPTTGHLWSSTEGYSSVGSDRGFLSVWSSPLDGSFVENHFSLYANGSGSLLVKVNGRYFDTLTYTSGITPGCIVVGGPATASAGQNVGFFSGRVRNVLVCNGPISDTMYQDAINGAYEPNSLTAYTLTLTNPGAEAGNASGWTNESGVLAVRSSNPLPHTGSYYFYDAGNAATLSRQRVALPAIEADIDAGKVWARINWWQASFSTGYDVSSCGLRFLSSSNTQLSQSTAAEYTPEPRLTWQYRSFALAAPANARNIDALIKMTRASGTASDGYTDDIEVIVYKQ